MGDTSDIKTVIICSDGAIRGGYIAGAFFALKKHCPEIWDTVTDFTAVSASIGGIFYEMAYGDDNPGYHLWTEAFSDSNLINFSNIFNGKRMYDIDYLVDVIFKEKNPCNIEKIGDSPYGYYFPLIDYDTGKTVIFNNRFEKIGDPNSPYDYRLINPELVYQYIRAATAAPILFDKTVTLEGRRYIDAGIRVPFLVDDELFKNHRKIVITAKGRLTFSNRLYYKTVGNLYSKFGKLLGANLDPKYYREIANKPSKYKDYESFLDGMGSESDVFYIHPQQKLGGRFDNSKETLIRNFEIGEEDLISSKEKLNKFVGVGKY